MGRRIGIAVSPPSQLAVGIKAIPQTTRSEDEFTATASRERRSITIFVVCFIVLPAVSILIYALYIQSPTNPRTPISEHNKVSERNSNRDFVNPVLAYITPWNSVGYDLAKSFNTKFTHLSPVWYDFEKSGEGIAFGRET